MPPGKWYATGDEIHIINPDGTEEVLSTSWEADRLKVRAVELAEKAARADALKLHLAEKRAQEEKRNARRASTRFTDD